MFYSASRNAFFDPAIHGSSIPSDAVEISAETHSDLMAAQALGQTIRPGDGGHPVAVDPPPPPEAEVWERLRRERDARLEDALALLDRHRNQVDFGLAPSLSDEQARAWAVYAQALRDLPEITTDPANPDWPEAPQ